MNSKNKNTLNEPSEVYQTSPKVETTTEELNPVLVKLLDKSIQEANEGKLIPHEEMMKKSKEKIASLK